MKTWNNVKAAIVALELEARDGMLVIGLALVGYGLWPMSHSAALIVPGAVLAGVAIFGVRG